MEINKYQELAMRTNDNKCTERLVKVLVDNKEQISLKTKIDMGAVINASLGLSGEVGELNDIIKKAIFHGHSTQIVDMKKELGDILWYIALMCTAFGWEMDEIAEINIHKLMNRYPNGFSEELSKYRKEDYE